MKALDKTTKNSGFAIGSLYNENLQIGETRQLGLFGWLNFLFGVLDGFLLGLDLW